MKYRLNLENRQSKLVCSRKEKRDARYFVSGVLTMAKYVKNADDRDFLQRALLLHLKNLKNK